MPDKPVQPRPPVVLRLLATLATSVLAVCIALPAIVIGSLAAVGISFRWYHFDERKAFASDLFADVAFVVAGFTLFVIGAILLRKALNAVTSQERSSAKWGAIAFAVAAPVVVAFACLLYGRGALPISALLWLDFGVFLSLLFAATWVLWSLRRRAQHSTVTAASVSIAAVLLVVIPLAELRSQPSMLEPFQGAQRQASGEVLKQFFHEFERPAPAVSTAGIGAEAESQPASHDSAGQLCFDRLAGEECDDVWHRTLDALGRDKAESKDALQAAYLYVCLEKSYPPPKLCGIFRLKAENVKIDVERYGRKFRDVPADVEPACSVPSAEDQALTQEELALLGNALARLDRRSRDILDLKYREDLTDAVIGARIGVSTVRARVLRREAEKALAEIVQRCHEVR